MACLRRHAILNPLGNGAVPAVRGSTVAEQAIGRNGLARMPDSNRQECRRNNLLQTYRTARGRLHACKVQSLPAGRFTGSSVDDRVVAGIDSQREGAAVDHGVVVDNELDHMARDLGGYRHRVAAGVRIGGAFGIAMRKLIDGAADDSNEPSDGERNERPLARVLALGLGAFAVRFGALAIRRSLLAAGPRVGFSWRHVRSTAFPRIRMIPGAGIVGAGVPFGDIVALGTHCSCWGR